ncbi:MAG TPA: hypothetical protein VFS47_08070 [Steroidobacteraceae bacterium]|nr:hypothetical protein [Steroidobacteraceae bacterium]
MLTMHLLGRMSLFASGVQVELPKSRKVRALLAYLAIAGKPVTRTHLCELLWEEPSDPKGELRWCLSRIRTALGAKRGSLIADRDVVHLDPRCYELDVAKLTDPSERGWQQLSPDELSKLSASTSGEFLEGLEIASTTFNSWLSMQRCRYRNVQLSLLSHLATIGDVESRLKSLEQWLSLEPLDVRAHEQLVRTLLSNQQSADAQAHIERTIRIFDAEQLDSAALRSLLRAPTASSLSITRSPTIVEPASPDPARRATVAVLPFQCAQGIEPADVRRIADALVHDLITRIAKLRSIHVVAPASMFTLRERGMSPTGVAEVLGADYVFNGTIRSDRTTCRFEVQLVHTSLSRVLWANSYDFRRQLTFEVLEDLGDKIVASVVSQIESNETRRAVLRSPESLDAWDSYHRGLWHAYRFNKLDNSRALHFFETAAKLDPTFSRAHAGISFAHFQTAMQRWDSREIAIQRALASASESLNADDCDPAAHWAMGRALWLQDEQTNALTELRKTLELSPNFALGHYTLAFVQAQSGDAKEAIAAADRSRRLSPFDPLLFGMLGARSIALLRLGDIEQAADCAKQAARRPNAHVHIFAIAACCAALAGQHDDARRYVMQIRRTRPQYRANDLLEAFRFDSNAQSTFTRGAAIAGLT